MSDRRARTELEPTPIDRWLERQAERERRRISLADALVGGAWVAYGWYRLRFFALRLLLRILLHGVNLAVLVRVFDDEEGVRLVAAAYAVLAIGRAAWWGLLEGLRDRIRVLFADGRGHLADREIRRWLGPATVAGGVLGAAVIAAWLAVSVVYGPDPAVAYLAVAALLTAVELPVRCYHSGLNAVRRVFRPLPIVMAVEFVGLVTLVALWPALGRWAAPIASLLAGVVVVAVTLRYSARTYWFIGLNPLDPKVRARPGPLGLTRREAWSALASAAMSIDATILVVLALAGGESTTLAAAAIVVVLPGLTGSVDWAQLFYFDLKRLEATTFGEFRRQVTVRIRRLAVVLGAGTGVVAALVAWIAVPDLPASTAAALVPLFVTRALLASVQVRAFAERAYVRVTVASLVVVGASIPIVAFESSTVVLLWLAAACLVGVALLWRSPERGPGPVGGRAWSLAEWLPAVAERDGPTLILVVRLQSHQHPLDPGSMALHLARDQVDALARAHPHAGVTMLGASEVGLVLTPGSPGEWVTRDALVGGAAGLLAELEVLEHDAGPSALIDLRARLRRDGRLLAESGLDPATGASQVMPEVDEHFDARVRNGLVGVPGDAHSVEQLRPSDRQELFSAVVSHARSGIPRSGGRYETTTVTDNGAIARYYGIPARAPMSLRRPWRATVVDAWFALALAEPTDESLSNASESVVGGVEVDAGRPSRGFDVADR